MTTAVQGASIEDHTTPRKPRQTSTPARYSSRIIKAGALIGDTKTLLSHWDIAASVAENIDRVQRENVFGKAWFASTIERISRGLLAALRDFEDKLRRAANLHLEPDLNDGVMLNIAPLHELVPWKEAKKYWDELLAGKYEWSTIGKQLREKDLVH